MKINNTRNINFKSGLSKTNIFLLSQIKPQKVEKLFCDTYEIQTKFKDNQTIAILNMLCYKILKNFAGEKILDEFSLLAKPSQIKVFEPSETVRNIFGDFCTTTSTLVTKGKKAPPISLFFENKHSALPEVNALTDFSKAENIISSGNFLSFTMHEWMHAAHLRYLYQNIVKNEEEMGNFIKTIKKMDFTPTEKALIQEFLGDYVYNNGKINPMEVIAEGLTRTICDCLSENKLKLTNSPNKILNNYPREFVSLLKKILAFNDF